MRGASPLLRRPFSRLSDVAGGALDIGGIGVFDADPGADYVATDGRILKASDYPDIGKVLPLTGGMAPISLSRSPVVVYNGLAAAGDYALFMTDQRDMVMTSKDGGDTFQIVPLKNTSGDSPYTLPGRIHAVACDPTGLIQIAATDGVTANSTGTPACAISTDGGQSFVARQLGNLGATAGPVHWLGGQFNGFAVGTTSGGYNGFDLRRASGAPLTFNTASTTGNITAIDINPDSGAVVLSGTQTAGLARYGNLFSSQSASGFPLSGSTIHQIKYRAGLWLVCTGNGIYRSTDDGQNFTIVPGTSGITFYTIAYSSGKWIAIASSNSARDAYILPSDATSAVLAANFIGPTGGGYSNSLLQAGNKYLMTIALSNPAQVFRSASTDPSAKFAVTPNLPSTGLILPKRYYMRAK